IWMLIILVAFSGVVGLVPMPTLAAVLIFAAVMSLRFNDMGVVWKTSHTGKIGMVVTFLATLALPVAAAVAVGVICSLLLQLNREQMDLRVVRLLRNEAGLLVEQPVPATLPDAEPVVLDVYGSLLYAGARTLGARLPDPRHSKKPVVILRLRGRTSLGSTFFGVIAGYADALDAAGGRLYLSGVQQQMIDRFHHSQVQDVQGKIRVFHATEVLGASTIAALEDARNWLIGEQPPAGPADDQAAG
ncbi:MAG: STAS domain-containing protein, partial [Nakamurella sp.]